MDVEVRIAILELCTIGTFSSLPDVRSITARVLILILICGDEPKGVSTAPGTYTSSLDCEVRGGPVPILDVMEAI